MFSEEPPSQLDCRPFDDANNWRLRIVCEVRIPVSQDLIEYEVHWFQRRNDSLIDHGRMEVQKSNTVERVAFGVSWINKKFTNDMIGEYWCQAILTGQQLHAFLPISNTVTIREPNSYNRDIATCTGPQFIRQQRCILGATNSQMTKAISSASVQSTTQELQATILAPTQTITEVKSSTPSKPIQTLSSRNTIDLINTKTATITLTYKSSTNTLPPTITNTIPTVTVTVTTTLPTTTSLLESPLPTTTSSLKSQLPTTTSSLESPIDDLNQPLMLIIVIAMACALTLTVSILFGIMIFLINKWRQNKDKSKYSVYIIFIINSFLEIIKTKLQNPIHCHSLITKPYYIESRVRAEPYYIEPAVMSEPHYMTPVTPVEVNGKEISSETSHSYESLASNTDYVSIYDSVTKSIANGNNSIYYTAIDTKMIQNNIYTDLSK